MGMGWGFLKQMNDTLKYNRDLLGKRKLSHEYTKEEKKKRRFNNKASNLKDLKERIEAQLKRNASHERTARITGAIFLITLVSGILWFRFWSDYSTKKKGKYDNVSQLFTTVIYNHPNGLKLRTDYYKQGTKASQTFYKDSLKHQNSESYYETGEQFRSALYFNDTIVVDFYFFKSGDTIKNFPMITDQKVHSIKFSDIINSRAIEFDFYDGKIIQGTYKEKALIN